MQVKQFSPPLLPRASIEWPEGGYTTHQEALT